VFIFKDRSNIQEIFLPIEGFEGLYEVGSLGNIKTLEREYKSGRYYHTQTLPEKILVVSIDKEGYRRVTLCKDGNKFYKRVNRLVCTAFHPNPENKPQVNHRNGIKWDDRFDNLEWATESENVLHANHFFGYKPTNMKKVIRMNMNGSVLKEYASLKEAEDEGFCRSNIRKVINGVYNHHAGFKWKYA
jgi:hypothetical protein